MVAAGFTGITAFPEKLIPARRLKGQCKPWKPLISTIYFRVEKSGRSISTFVWTGTWDSSTLCISWKVGRESSFTGSTKCPCFSFEAFSSALASSSSFGSAKRSRAVADGTRRARPLYGRHPVQQDVPALLARVRNALSDGSSSSGERSR